MPFLIEQNPEHAKERAEFILHSELSAIRMMEFSASRAERLPEAEQLRLEMKHRTEKGAGAGGRQTFVVELEVRSMAADGGAQVFEVKARFEAEYTLSPGFAPTEGQLQAFKEGNAAFHCWPYFREFVQSSTQRMGLSVPPMPMLVLTAGAAPGRRRGGKRAGAAAADRRDREGNGSRSSRG